MTARFLILPALALSLSACVATTDTTPVVTTSQTFSLADGNTLAVTRNGAQARLTYPATYRLTDAETVSYIEDGTGCSPGILLDQRVSDAHGLAIRTYSLNCG